MSVAAYHVLCFRESSYRSQISTDSMGIEGAFRTMNSRSFIEHVTIQVTQTLVLRTIWYLYLSKPHTEVNVYVQGIF
jgi:hypothetical protein